jgi:hypothetical protein
LPLAATWLKSKGDEFFKNADFDSAINAYTAALTSDAASIPCLLNRAACHLHKGAAAACARDCDDAIAQLDKAAAAPGATPASAAKARQQRVRALARRMAAAAGEGKYAAALVDARAAAELDEGLGDAVQRLEAMLQAQKVKEMGDKAAAAAAAAAGAEEAGSRAEARAHVDDALARYGEALALEPQYALAALNRSALLLKEERVAECAADCRTVLALLGVGAGGGAAGGAAGGEADELAPVPRRGTQLYGQVLQRAQARLAECDKRLGPPPPAATDAQAQPAQVPAAAAAAPAAAAAAAAALAPPPAAGAAPRCGSCGGWGVGVVKEHGFCEHCHRKQAT